MLEASYVAMSNVVCKSEVVMRMTSGTAPRLWLMKFAENPTLTGPKDEMRVIDPVVNAVFFVFHVPEPFDVMLPLSSDVVPVIVSEDPLKVAPVIAVVPFRPEKLEFTCEELIAVPGENETNEAPSGIAFTPPYSLDRAVQALARSPLH